MSDEETHEGWKNRETWAFNLHWANDQGLYNETLERAREYLVETYGHAWDAMPEDELKAAAWGVGEHIRDYWHDAIKEWHEYDPSDTERLPETLAMFRDEVGSWWRVDPGETGANVLESLGNG